MAGATETKKIDTAAESSKDNWLEGFVRLLVRATVQTRRY